MVQWFLLNADWTKTMTFRNWEHLWELSELSGQDEFGVYEYLEPTIWE